MNKKLQYLILIGLVYVFLILANATFDSYKIRILPIDRKAHV